MKTKIASVFIIAGLLLGAGFSRALAAAPDGAGPWADSVSSFAQGLTKGGGAVPAIRSDPTSALGVAEDNTTEGNFVSLGFGGSLTLQFDNPISNGVIFVEATNLGYPTESASVQLSADGTTWVSAGTVLQDGSVAMPESLSCAQYVRITDTSNPVDFPEPEADGYDVDGVQATQGEACTPVTPTPTPTLTPTPTQPPPPSDGGGNSGGNSGGNNSPGTPPVCSDAKPPTPTLNSVTRSGSTAQLSWSAVSPVTHYSISYGTSPGSYAFGVPNTGNVTSFTVGGLNPSTTYYFVVRAVNGCTPGDPSNQRSTGGGGGVLGATTEGQVLGASTDTLAATGSSAIYLRLILASSVSALFFMALSLRRQG